MLFSKLSPKLRRLLAALALLGTFGFATGCASTMEEAGDEIEEAGDEIEDAADDIDR